MLLLVVSLCGCTCSGVRSKSMTVWELAGWLSEQDEPKFIPMCVECMSCKSTIEGYTLIGGEEVPASVVCDMKNDKVSTAILIINDSIHYVYYHSR